MASPLLVACERHVWDDLVSRSGLPASVFSDGPPMEGAGAPIDGIFHLGEIAKDPDRMGAAELEQIDRILFACKDGAFVWLHRFEDGADAELERLMQASAAWSKLVAERKRRHDAYIRPMAILVGGDTTRASETEFRSFLTKVDAALHQAPGQAAICFKDVFVMSPRLEPLEREIFHARSIWPIAVSRLMLSLVCQPSTNDAATVKAWRFKEFRRTDAQSLYERLLPAFTDALFDRFRSAEPSVAKIDHPAAQVVTSFVKREPSAGQWPSSEVSAISVKETDPKAVLHRLEAAGKEDSRQMTKSAADAWSVREGLLHRFWSGVHERSGTAWAAEEQLRQQKSPVVDDANNHLKSIGGQQLGISLAGDRLKDGAAEIELAESWFVQRWFRLAIGLTAASLLGVLFFRGGLLHFQDVAIAIMVASGAFVGAMLSVSFFYVMESRQGAAALDEWNARHEAFEDAVKTLNDRLVGLKNAASVFSVATAHGTRRSKTLRLLSRMTGAVEPVFQSTMVADVSGGGDARTEGFQSPLRYLAASTVASDEPGRKEWRNDQDLIDSAINQLLDEKGGVAEKVSSRWGELLERGDRDKQGVIDAGNLRRAISDELLSLPGEIDRVIAKEGEKSSDDNPSKAFVDLIKSRLDASDHDERGLFSVEVADGVRTDFARYVLVSQSVDGQELDDEDRVFALPRSAAACFPALLIETASIRPTEDIVPVGRIKTAEG